MDNPSHQKREVEEPPGRRHCWTVALIGNIKGETEVPKDAPPDAGAEFDKTETIQSILCALEAGGHKGIFLPADNKLISALLDTRPDICFNIAEGLYGDGREAQIPALLELLRIPYTASRVVANAISLEKTITKRIWRDAQLPVAPFQEFTTGEERIRPGLRFPLFVKPSREGTGMGVDLGAVVSNESELRNRIGWVINTYKQPALVEAFLPGREFTVGVLGRPDAKATSKRPELYDATGFHHFPILEIESYSSITPGVYGYKAKSKSLTEIGAPGYLCPAKIDARLAEQLYKLAFRAHRAIGALDVSRVDFRMDGDGNPCLLEINTLPGLSPGYSDLCIVADAEGLTYKDLILEILDLAASRFSLLN